MNNDKGKNADENKRSDSKETREPLKKNFLIQVKEFLELKYVFRKNVLTNNIEYFKVGAENFRILDDDEMAKIWCDLYLADFKVGDNMLRKVTRAFLATEYDPIREYFENLPPHDGHDHIADLAATVKIADLESHGVRMREVWEPFLRKWLVASAVNALTDKTNDTALILCGSKGKGKSKWLNKLCPPDLKHLSHEGVITNMKDEVTMNLLAEKFMANLDDQLQKMTPKELHALKPVISCTYLYNRKTHQQFDRRRPRRCNIVGSLDDPEYIEEDETRRFLTFTPESIDYLHEVDMDKIWSQALEISQTDFTYWVTGEEILMLSRLNNLYRKEQPEEAFLLKMFAPCDPDHEEANFLMSSEILSRINDVSRLRLSLTNLSKALKRYDYRSIKKRLPVGSRKVWVVRPLGEVDELSFQLEMKKEYRKK